MIFKQWTLLPARGSLPIIKIHPQLPSFHLPHFHISLTCISQAFVITFIMLGLTTSHNFNCTTCQVAYSISFLPLASFTLPIFFSSPLLFFPSISFSYFQPRSATSYSPVEFLSLHLLPNPLPFTLTMAPPTRSEANISDNPNRATKARTRADNWPCTHPKLTYVLPERERDGDEKRTTVKRPDLASSTAFSRHKTDIGDISFLYD